MQIRLATPSDIPAIMQIVRRVVPLMRAQGNLQWDDTYPNPEVFAEDIAQGQLWLAEVDSSLTGVIAITAEQEPEYAHAAWDYTQPAIVVHRLVVDPVFRGRGVAAALVQQAEIVAHDRSISFVRADTNTENQAAQRLFPKLGYRPAGEITLHFRPGQRFLCYEKQLSISPGGG